MLLLDEATAGLDLVGREQVLETVAALHEADAALTLLLTTHHLEELPATTTQVVLMSNGRLVANGPPAGVLVDETLSNAYGARVIVTCASGRYFAVAHRTTARGWVQG